MQRDCATVVISRAADEFVRARAQRQRLGEHLMVEAGPQDRLDRPVAEGLHGEGARGGRFQDAHRALGRGDWAVEGLAGEGSDGVASPIRSRAIAPSRDHAPAQALRRRALSDGYRIRHAGSVRRRNRPRGKAGQPDEYLVHEGKEPSAGWSSANSSTPRCFGGLPLSHRTSALRTRCTVLYALNDRYEFDFHEELRSRKGNDLHRGSCWCLSSKERSIRVVHLGEICHIRQENGCLYDTGETRARRAEHLIGIPEHLSCLLSHIVLSDKLACLWVRRHAA